MNLLLLDDGAFEGEFSGSGTISIRARLRDRRRIEHLRKVLRAQPGDEITIGRRGGRIGRARIIDLGADDVLLEGELDRPPPARRPVVLVLALARPPMMRRLLEAVTAMGIERLILLHTARVEKSFWQSSVLTPESIERHLTLGLEQAVDTVAPVVEQRRRFRPFVEDELPELLVDRRGWFAHPGEQEVLDLRAQQISSSEGEQVGSVLVVGPEGGFVPFEVDLLRRAGCRGIGLGERLLRVETAVIAMLSRFAACAERFDP